MILNTEESPGDMKRLDVPQTPVENNQLTLVWKTCQEWNNKKGKNNWYTCMSENQRSFRHSIYEYRTLAWWLECSPMARETGVQFQVESCQRLKKWYLMPPCLTPSIIRYWSRVKWSNPGKGVAPSPTSRCSSYREGSLWVFGVRGNERADSAAKSALDLTPDKSRISFTDLKPTINKFLHTKWQQQWSNNIHNKLFQIQPTLGEWRSPSRKSRRKQVVISRLRIGYTRLTHSFILKQEPQPQCLTCQTTCTVKHILIECRTFAVIRKRFFKVNNLTDLFENVKIDDILSFLRETELYQKIWQLKTG